jgi:hypothetical protein
MYGTYAGKAFGETGFVSEMVERFGRYWNRGMAQEGRLQESPRKQTKRWPIHRVNFGCSKKYKLRRSGRPLPPYPKDI